MRCGLLRYNSEAHKDCQGSQLEILFPHSTQSSCMHQNKFDKTHENAGQATWSVYLNVVVYFSLSLILTLLVWFLPWLVSPGVLSASGWVFALVITYAITAILLERGLFFTGLRRDWHYRLAFLISASLALIQVVVYQVTDGNLWYAPAGTGLHWSVDIYGSLVAVILTTLGAFGGALLATGLNEGLLEVNTPPASLTLKVYQQHLQSIGVPGAEPGFKRWFDVILSFIGLILSAPVWIVGAFLVWLEDPGPILFVKNSIGKGGKNFRLFKFRTMALEMEKSMALVQTQEVQANTLFIGRLLRKTALDELPQLINILNGEMSFVGPRPHRTPLVALYLEQMPEFSERHRVLPGLAGLAQVSGDFYMTPRQKLRFDRLYIRNRSLGFDVKLLFLAFMIAFWYRWQKDWNGRLPRNLFRYGSRTQS